MSTLIEWLDEALRDAGTHGNATNPIRRLLVIQVVASTGERPQEAAGDRGWFYQTYVPLSTLLSVRKTGQSSHNERELDLLGRYWDTKGVGITTASFVYRGPSPPLSWHLTAVQKRNLAAQWSAQRGGADWQRVMDFVSRMPPEPLAHAEAARGGREER